MRENFLLLFFLNLLFSRKTSFNQSMYGDKISQKNNKFHQEFIKNVKNVKIPMI